jgi:uncharacterized protein (TIGR02246 family)
MPRTRNLLILFLPLLVLACDTPDVGEAEFDAEGPAEMGPAMPADAEAGEAELARIRDAWVEGALAGDAASVAALYAEDARMVNLMGEVAEGRQSIQDAFATGFEGISSLQVNSTDVVVGSDVMTDMGTFTQTYQTPDGQEQTLNGEYLVVLRRQPDGSWKLVQHLSSIPQAEDADAM